MTINEDGTEANSIFTDDDDSDDSFEKKIKEEDESDSDMLSDEEEAFMRSIKKVTPRPTEALNGTAKKIPANLPLGGSRIVRVSQKQIPSLSSGVYIMSKTDGIIKLDSNTSQAITKGRQVIKIGSKIGQTQIKVINLVLIQYAGKIYFFKW